MTRTELNQDQKTLIHHVIMQSCINGKPPRGIYKELVETHGCHWKTISRVWKEATRLKGIGAGGVIFKNKKKEAIRPKKHIPDLVAIQAISPEKRQHVRDLALHIPPSKSTIGRWMVEGLLKYHTTSLKPCLTPACKLPRLRFTLNSLSGLGPNANKFIFKNMHNICHLDEKWFNQRKAHLTMIGAPGEEEVYRQGNKQHIPKVSFLCVVAKPLISPPPENEVIFDGKIGVWEFTEKYQSIRRSRNRQAGVWLTRPLQHITREVYKEYLINKVVPAVILLWPHEILGKVVYIQQDNAPTHIKTDDPDFVAAATVDGWDIRLICQPANSPDLNINDLGWFSVLQSLCYKTRMRNIEDIIGGVQKAYADMKPQTLKDVFMTLQDVYREIMKAKGHNNYKMPHLGKNNQRINGTLPENLEVDEELVKDCILYLMEHCEEAEMDELISNLGINFLLT